MIMSSKSSGFAFKDVPNYVKAVQDMSWSIDGSQLATASNDKTYKILQVESQGGIKVIQNIPSPLGGATQVKWHPSEKSRFAVAGDDLVIDLWDVRAPKAASKLTSLGGNLFIGWSPDGRYMASVNKNDVLTVYDIATGQKIHEITFEHEVNEFAWNYHSDHLLVASEQGGIQVINFDQNQLTKSEFVQAHTSNCHQLKIWDPVEKGIGSRQQAIIALGGADFQVTLWDLDDLICHTTICIESEVRGICLSSDGNYLGIASEDPNISFYSTTTGKFISKADSRTTFHGMAWHPTSNLIAVAADDRTANISGVSCLRFLSYNNLNF